MNREHSKKSSGVDWGLFWQNPLVEPFCGGEFSGNSFVSTRIYFGMMA